MPSDAGAILAIVRYTGERDALERGLSRMVEVADHLRPAGFRFHASAVTDDGLVIVDIWDSEEAFAAWREDPEFRREFQVAGLPRPSIVEIHPLHTVWPAGVL
ncbi:MAG TPA: antibiotic biosynthesis monooxygenase [Planosporangium sp.]|jgi:heme-degrading monooxygenase HmoA|nr:antibiotic biosynthesis monooxygenase [Planosporangium sp.]